MGDISNRVRAGTRDIKYNIKDNSVVYSLLFVGALSLGLGALSYSNNRKFEINTAMLNSGAKTYSQLVEKVCGELKKHQNLSDIAKLCEESKDLTNAQLEAYNRIVSATFINHP